MAPKSDGFWNFLWGSFLGVGQTPWSARDPQVPLFANPKRPTRASAADQGVCPTKTHDYSFGTGGGSSRATTLSENPTRLWLPSQKGLFADWPQRHSEMMVRPASPNGAPVGSRISNSPSIRMEPSLLTVTL